MSARPRSHLDPVLLLHGQPGGAHDWDRVTAAMAGRATAIAIDRPGWGRASGTAGGLAPNARAALFALDRAGAARAIVVGHSFGGAVAAWLAAEHPDRVIALVLASPSANGASLYKLDHLLAARVIGDALVVAAVGGPGLVLAVPPARRMISARLGLAEDYLLRAGAALRAPRAWKAFVTEQRALIDDLPALEQRLGRISTPTTVVIGAHDWVVPAGSARRLAGQIPGARLVEVPGAGHLLPQRQAPRLAELIVALGG